MDLRLLGPLELWAGGRHIELGQPRQRLVLAALAAGANRLLTVPSLVDRVWDEAPPDSARSTLYSHVSRIRRVLDEAARHEGGAAGQPPLELVRVSGGYLLKAAEDSIDLLRFRALVARARGLRPEDPECGRLLRDALDLWRGSPLADLPGAWAERTRAAWLNERLEAALQWGRAESAAGRTPQAIGRMRSLADEYPLAEPLAALLIRSLARTGRTAEALDHYTEVRRRLGEELGALPGAELRTAYEETLREQPASGGTPSGPAPDPGRKPSHRPAQLPTDVRAFTGRAEQLDELSRHLLADADGAGPTTTVVVSAVSGTAGVGKTALAVHWSHRVRERFPDGQLYADLRGYDTDEPVPAADVLTGFLVALGVPGSEIPLRVDDRSARYRTELSERRMLVVLDNASSSEQIRPLLPGAALCRTVVTSRDTLSSLVSLHGAHRLVLDVLPPGDAVRLLRTLIGPRAVAEPQAAAVLAEQCGRLPLALRIAAELALSRPASPLSALTAELEDQRGRLELLDSDDDPRAAVRAVFSWSYDRLPAEAAATFRLLGLHPGPDVDAYAAAALCGRPVADTRRTLDLLARSHLIQPTRPGRHGMHDLLRVYAAWQAERLDGAGDRAAALDRLLTHYLAASCAAMDVLFPAERQLRPRVQAPATELPPLSTEAHAKEWLASEHSVLPAVIAAEAARGRAKHAVGLATTLHRHFDSRGLFTDGLAVHGNALRAARAAGDRRGEAEVRTCLGVTHRRLAQYDEAVLHHTAALELCRGNGLPVLEARNLTNLGVLHELRGRYREAAERHEEAVVLFRKAGDIGGEADALNNLGIIHELLEEYETAAVQHRQALVLYRAIGHSFGEASALGNLGIVLSRLDQHATAAEHFEQALALFRRLGHRGGEAHALSNLGDAHSRLGHHRRAAEHQRAALALFQRTGERYGEAGSLNGLGEALHGSGQSAEALAAHRSALALATEIEEKEEQARARIGMARIHQGRGDLPAAREQWQEALALYSALGSPRVAGVSEALSALDALS
ncbi:AfsR/SARP family transcriptional regulator [Streptomyces beigongshangae]|uniref:AfsR/SARP family transcriptional regulator n=1 Tax=Streptomyces beigongshangae TaxID=2841597 RepID=UPI0027E0B858|nr:tetratricopeptide repeat protein [Streptomyces sp. REN17]